MSCIVWGSILFTIEVKVAKSVLEELSFLHYFEITTSQDEVNHYFLQIQWSTDNATNNSLSTGFFGLMKIEIEQWFELVLFPSIHIVWSSYCVLYFRQRCFEQRIESNSIVSSV